MATDVCIIGHSYIRRLRDFTTTDISALCGILELSKSPRCVFYTIGWKWLVPRKARKGDHGHFVICSVSKGLCWYSECGNRTAPSTTTLGLTCIVQRRCSECQQTAQVRGGKTPGNPFLDTSWFLDGPDLPGEGCGSHWCCLSPHEEISSQHKNSCSPSFKIRICIYVYGLSTNVNTQIHCTN